MKLLTNSMMRNVSGANYSRCLLRDIYLREPLNLKGMSSKELATFTTAGVLSTALTPVLGIMALIHRIKS